MEKLKSSSFILDNEIDTEDFITQARQQQKEKKYSTAEYLLHLTKAYPHIQVKNKFLIFSIDSFIASKTDDIYELRRIGNRLLTKYHKDFYTSDSLEKEMENYYIKILYRSACLEDKMKINKEINYLVGFLFWKTELYCKRLKNSQVNNEDRESNFSEINERYMKTLNILSEILREKHVEINNINSVKEISELADNVKYYLKEGINRLDDNKATDATDDEDSKVSNNNRDYYLVSLLWLDNFLNFSEKFSQNSNNEALFDRRKVLKLFFGNCINQYSDDCVGSYPGPINNYSLISFNKVFKNDNESGSNDINISEYKEFNEESIFIKTSLIEKRDFQILPSNIYQKLKQLFSSIYDIPRKERNMFNEKNDDNNNNKKNDRIIELSLKHFKVLIFSNSKEKDLIQELSFPRNIQFSKSRLFKDFKNKIIDKTLLQVKSNLINNNINTENVEKLLLENNLNKESLLRRMKIYKLEAMTKEERKKEIFKILFAYKSGVKWFKFEGDEVNINDDDYLENSKLANEGEIILIDITDTDDKANNISRFLNCKSHETLCSCCYSIIDKDNESNKNISIHCNNCDQFPYCSEECKNKDIEHQQYHKDLIKLYKNKFNIQDLLHTQLNTLVPNTICNKGKTGLRNLGNTCFMNSALQCLSHVVDLTKYFLMKYNTQEINLNNKYGSGGEIAKAYQSLITELWCGSANYLSPWDFRQIFIHFVKQFAGFNQHDSHEMLVFMLDALHEDLNRIKFKPYQELNERYLEETVKQASERWWLSHLKRENSIIVDLFHGQYKSVVKCPTCDRVSTTFDPFMYLPLSIPSISTFTISFCVINNECSLRILTEKIDNDMEVDDLIIRLSEFLGVNKRFIIPIIINSGNKIVRRISPLNYRIKSIYDNKLEILFFQHNDDKFINSNYDSLNHKRLIYTMLMQYKVSYSYDGREIKNVEPFIYPQPFIVSETNTIGNFKLKIFKTYRNYLEKVEGNSFENDNSIKNTNNNIENSEEPSVKVRKGSADYCEFKAHEDDYSFLKKEAELYYGKEKTIETETKENNDNIENNNNIDNKHIVITVFNNDPEKSINKSAICNLCNSASCSNCELSLPDSSLFSELFKKISFDRVILLLFEIKDTVANKTLKNLSSSLNLTKNHIIDESDDISIYDCLANFKKTEKLEEDNTWYCNVCKEHKEAFKTLSIYKPPLYLIIQLKRFKVRTSNVMFSSIMNQKNDALVEFPLKNLILDEYVDNSEDNNNIIKVDSSDVSVNDRDKNKNAEFKYDLFAVSQHYGSMGGGHYTAVARNNGDIANNSKNQNNESMDNDSWSKFDDERVYRISEDAVVDESAYILFYKRSFN